MRMCVCTHLNCLCMYTYLCGYVGTTQICYAFAFDCNCGPKMNGCPLNMFSKKLSFWPYMSVHTHHRCVHASQSVCMHHRVCACIYIVCACITKRVCTEQIYASRVSRLLCNCRHPGRNSSRSQTQRLRAEGMLSYTHIACMHTHSLHAHTFCIHTHLAFTHIMHAHISCMRTYFACTHLLHAHT